MKNFDKAWFINFGTLKEIKLILRNNLSINSQF